LIHEEALARSVGLDHDALSGLARSVGPSVRWFLHSFPPSLPAHVLSRVNAMPADYVLPRRETRWDD
jgi:hypothetical protein